MPPSSAPFITEVTDGPGSGFEPRVQSGGPEEGGGGGEGGRKVPRMAEEIGSGLQAPDIHPIYRTNSSAAPQIGSKTVPVKNVDQLPHTRT